MHWTMERPSLWPLPVRPCRAAVKGRWRRAGPRADRWTRGLPPAQAHPSLEGAPIAKPGWQSRSAPSTDRTRVPQPAENSNATVAITTLTARRFIDLLRLEEPRRVRLGGFVNRKWRIDQPFHLPTAVAGKVNARVNGQLCRRHRLGRQLGEGHCEVLNPLMKPLDGIHIVHQADHPGGLGVDPAVKHGDPLGPVRAHEASEPADTPAARNHPQPDFGQTPDRLFGRQPNIARAGHLKAATEARPLSSQNDRLFDTFELVVQQVMTTVGPSPLGGVLVGHRNVISARRAPGDINARGEIPADRRDDQDPEVIALVESLRCSPKKLSHQRTNGVQLVLAVKRDGDDTCSLRDPGVLVLKSDLRFRHHFAFASPCLG